MDDYKSFSLDNIFIEKSHGDLKSSFRLGINTENGHKIKIVFDLKREDIKHIGAGAEGQIQLPKEILDQLPKEARDRLQNNDAHTKNIIKNILKTGHTDFSSSSIVKAIVDMDTNQNLNTVKAFGIVYAEDAFGVGNGRLSDKAKLLLEVRKKPFIDLEVKAREFIFQSSPNIDRNKNTNIYKVGEREPNPSYKSTKFVSDYSKLLNAITPSLMDNKLPPMRGVKADKLHKESAYIVEGELIDLTIDVFKGLCQGIWESIKESIGIKNTPTESTITKSMAFGNKKGDKPLSMLPKELSDLLAKLNTIAVECARDIGKSSMHSDLFKNENLDDFIKYISTTSGVLLWKDVTKNNKTGEEKVRYTSIIVICDGFFEDEGTPGIKIPDTIDWEDWCDYWYDVESEFYKRIQGIALPSWVNEVNNGYTYHVGLQVDATDEYVKSLWNKLYTESHMEAATPEYKNKDIVKTESANGEYKFPKPTRNNLSKEEASNCKHKWAYGGGSMWCVHCGWFQQTDGKITKTVSGKSGEFLESVFIDVSDYFEERSHGLLNFSFRMGINKENGHLVKIVFDLKPKDIKRIGSHDDTNPVKNKSERDNIKKNIRKTGYTDFTSYGKVLAITDMDTKERLTSVKATGIQGGNQEYARLPLAKREELLKNGGFNGYGASTFIVGEQEDDEEPATYKSTKPAAKVDDLVKFQNNPMKMGRGNNMKESVNTPEYNTDMTEVQAKKTMRTLSQSLMNDIDAGKKMTQYTANIYANIITKNLLPKWANGFSRVKITLDSYQSFHTFEFITPPMGQDFVSRFINGRETLQGLLHRSPEIRIKMSPKIFHKMKNPDDAFNFFKAAIKYYDSQVERYGVKVVAEAMKLGHNMKHLISNTKLSGIVTYPLTMLFVFDDVDMSNKDTFKISNEDIQTINRFIKNISSRYAAPEKEKKQIVDDVKKMVEALKESCEPSDSIRSLHYLPEAVDMLMFGGYDKMIVESSRLFIEAQVDRDWVPTPEVKYMKESWGVKKLKKIPKDLIPYIQIETEAIKDVNDKMILSSYTLGKIEIVEWYIELLTVGSKKYIVPHTKPYLELVRTQLLQCFKKIMDTSVNKNDKIIDLKYPPGYEG